MNTVLGTGPPKIWKIVRNEDYGRPIPIVGVAYSDGQAMTAEEIAKVAGSGQREDRRGYWSSSTTAP